MEHTGLRIADCVDGCQDATQRNAMQCGVFILDCDGYPTSTTTIVTSAYTVILRTELLEGGLVRRGEGVFSRSVWSGLHEVGMVVLDGILDERSGILVGLIWCLPS